MSELPDPPTDNPNYSILLQALGVVEWQTRGLLRDDLATLHLRTERFLKEGRAADVPRLAAVYFAIAWQEWPDRFDETGQSVLQLIASVRHHPVCLGQNVAASGVGVVEDFLDEVFADRQDDFRLDSLFEAVSAALRRGPSLKEGHFYPACPPPIRTEDLRPLVMRLCSADRDILERLYSSSAVRKAAVRVRAREFAEWFTGLISHHDLQRVNAEVEIECATARRLLAPESLFLSDPSNNESPANRRGAWLLRRYREGAGLTQIRLELEREAQAKGWEPLASDQGVHRAIVDYCKRQRIPRPRRYPRRQHRRDSTEGG
jgi:hypothetical protein